MACCGLGMIWSYDLRAACRRQPVPFWSVSAKKRWSSRASWVRSSAGHVDITRPTKSSRFRCIDSTVRWPLRVNWSPLTRPSCWSEVRTISPASIAALTRRLAWEGSSVRARAMSPTDGVVGLLRTTSATSAARIDRHRSRQGASLRSGAEGGE